MVFSRSASALLRQFDLDAFFDLEIQCASRSPHSAVILRTEARGVKDIIYECGRLPIAELSTTRVLTMDSITSRKLHHQLLNLSS